MKLGIIGFSDGNGHPYSWSAIFNGYDDQAMEECGFPIIPRYLEQQSWPDCQIKDAEVSRIWTQDIELSRHVAKAGRIKHVVSAPSEMIGKIDALLLARDDAENNLEFAAPFLKAGLPIYIDKPIALTVSALKSLYELEQYPGQIFSCSALRYSPELSLDKDAMDQVGSISDIVAFTPKSWDKYAVHIIEPVLKMLSTEDRPVCCSTLSSGGRKGASAELMVRWSSGVRTTFIATGEGLSPIVIRVIGNKGYKDLQFSDSFSAFKCALNRFVGIAKNRRGEDSEKDFLFRVVNLLEEGRK